jgi:DNA repair protein RadC
MSRSTRYTPNAYRAAKVTRVRTATPLDEGESAQLLEALRANQQLLCDLMLRYDTGHAPVATQCKRSVAPTIRSPQDVWDLFGDEMSCLVQEQLRVVLLDTKHRLIRWEMVYQGTVDAITVRPAELLRPALLENAPAVLLVHNHPSGAPEPSPEDIQTTEHTMAAGKLLCVDVLDHVVLGKDGRYVSIQGRRLARHWTRGLAA